MVFVRYQPCLMDRPATGRLSGEGMRKACGKRDMLGRHRRLSGQSRLSDSTWKATAVARTTKARGYAFLKARSPAHAAGDSACPPVSTGPARLLKELPHTRRAWVDRRLIENLPASLPSRPGRPDVRD